MLSLVAFELPSGWVEGVCEDLGVLPVILHPVVQNGSCRGYEASDDVGDRDGGSVELFGVSILVQSTQDVCHDVRLPRNVVNRKIEFLESVHHVI